MRFAGFYNFGGAGTEEVTGGTNENIPSHTENVCNNDRMFISGQFSNLSRHLLHISLTGFGTTDMFHKHDLRPYESLNCIMCPIKQVALHVPVSTKVGFHGMGLLWEAEDEDEYAVMAAKSSLTEDLHNSPDFNTDTYKDVQETTATTFDVWLPSTDTDIGLYKLTISSSGANTVKVFWTDSSNTNIENIGLIRFGNEGTFVYDFDASNLRNPNGQNGKLRATTTAATTVDIQAIGHEIKASQ